MAVLFVGIDSTQFTMLIMFSIQHLFTEMVRHMLEGAETFDTRVWVAAVAVVMGTLVMLALGTCYLLYRECHLPSSKYLSCMEYNFTKSVALFDQLSNAYTKRFSLNASSNELKFRLLEALDEELEAFPRRSLLPKISKA